MRKIKYLIIIMLFFISIKNVHAIPKFDNTIKVYDYAQVLTDKEESKLKKEVINYINKYNMDMVIVTVKYYTQSTTREYINAFYNQNGFGKGINKDGIMVVIDLKNNNISIKTFGRTINYYSENEINNIIDRINSEDHYYDKLDKFINYSDKYLNEFDNNYTKDISAFSIFNWIGILIPSLIVPTIVIVIGLLKNNNVRKKNTAHYYIVENSVVINTKDDKFITTNTKKTRLNNK